MGASTPRRVPSYDSTTQLATRPRPPGFWRSLGTRPVLTIPPPVRMHSAASTVYSTPVTTTRPTAPMHSSATRPVNETRLAVLTRLRATRLLLTIRPLAHTRFLITTPVTLILRRA